MAERKYISFMKDSTPSIKEVDHWSRGLIRSMTNPDEKLEEDDLIVVIKDKYPKARFHFLVLPKKDILSISKVTSDDLPLLDHMESIAKKYVNQHKDHEFQIGYHAIPSMQRLHLHVISTDFNSPCLRTKQHWNSFTTPFFIYTSDIREQLVEYGEIQINIKIHQAYLSKNLMCHKCSYMSKTIPDLKRHIIQHIPFE